MCDEQVIERVTKRMRVGGGAGELSEVAENTLIPIDQKRQVNYPPKQQAGSNPDQRHMSPPSGESLLQTEV